MKTTYHRHFAVLARLGLVLLLGAATAPAIEIDIPEQYQEEVERLRAEEKNVLEEQLEQIESGEVGGDGTDAAEEAATGDDGMQFTGQGPSEDTAPDAGGGETPTAGSGDFLLESVEAAEGAAETYEEDLPENQGLVSGQVVDQESGAPVPGVAILLEGTDTGTITDAEGRYSLGPAPAGQYTLSFVKSGYIEANVTEFQVKPDQVSVFPFALPPRPAEMSDEVYELQDFTVTAQEAATMTAQLMDLRRQSIGSMDALSSEDFSKFAAGDAAEALSKTSGASLSEGKYAVIRGLNDRYNTVLINRARLPSPDPDRKAIALDIFTTSLFESLVLRKTFTSELPGESSGGSIALNTKSVPEDPFLNVSIGVSAQQGARSEFLSDPDRTSFTEWVTDFGEEDNRGFDENGEVKAPNEFANIPFPLFAAERRRAPIDRSGSISFGDSFDVGENVRLGYLFGTKTSAKYRSQEKKTEETSVNNSGELEVQERAFRETGTESFQYAVLAGLEADIKETHNLRYNYLRSESSDTASTLSSVFRDASEEIGNQLFITGELALELKTIEAHQFEGSHALGFLDSFFSEGEAELGWYYTDASVIQEEPDVRSFENWEVTNKSVPGLLGPNGQPVGVPEEALLLENGESDSNPDVPPVRFDRETVQDSSIFGFRFESGKVALREDVTWSFDFGLDRESSDRDFEQIEWQKDNIGFPGPPSSIAAPTTAQVNGQTFFDDVDEAISAQEAAFQNRIQGENVQLNQLNNTLGNLQGNLATEQASLQQEQDELQDLIDLGADDPTSPLNPFFVNQQQSVANSQADVANVQADITDVQMDITSVQDGITALQGVLASIDSSTESFFNPLNNTTQSLTQTPFGFGFTTSSTRAAFRPNDPIVSKAVGSNEVTGLYFGQRMEAGFLTFAAGLRMESTELNYDDVPGFPGALGSVNLGGLTFSDIEGVDQTDYLPYLSLIARLFEEQVKVQASFSRTIGKPTFREIAPFPLLNLTDKTVEVGNAGFITTGAGQPLFASPGTLAEQEALAREFAGLSISDVTNFDLRFEWFTPQDGLIAIGAFAKTIENPIERAQVNTISGVDITSYVNNNNDASLRGMEFEVRQNLEIFGDFWAPLTVGGNYTVIDAEVTRSDLELANFSILESNVAGITRDDFETRALFDQPEFVANAFVSWDFERTGTQVTLSGNFVGEQLSRAGSPGGTSGEGSLDLLWREFFSLNLVVNQRINDTWSLSFAAENINSPQRELVEDPELFSRIPVNTSGNPDDDPLNGPIRKEFTIEPSFSISVSASF